MQDTALLQSVRKALRVLRLIAEAGRPLTLSEIAQRSGYGSTVVFRLVRTLEAEGYVARAAGTKAYAPVAADAAVPLTPALGLFRALAETDQHGAATGRLAAKAGLAEPQAQIALERLAEAGLVEQRADGGWAISPGILGYARGLLRDDPVLQALRPLMRSLSARLQETVTWFRRAGDLQVVVEAIPSPQPICYVLPSGSRHSLSRGAAGKACLAALTDADIAAYLGRTMADQAQVGALLAELEQVRACGFATSRGERVDNAAAVAVAVEGPDGAPAGVLSVMAPAFRMSDAQARALGPDLVAATRGLFSASAGARREIG